MIRRSAKFIIAMVGGLIGPLSLTAQSPEIRGVWADAFHPGFRNEAEIARMIQDIRAANLNSLFVEVRKRGDAYYRSQLTPLASNIAPGFDPLASIIRHAKETSEKPAIEAHAWFVMFPLWNHFDEPPTQADHLFLTHPDWISRDRSGRTWDGANYYLEPAHPEVRDHLVEVVLEVVRNYDINGAHLDYIRYSGTAWGYHDIAIERFNRIYQRQGAPTPEDPDWMQFRRDQVTSLVQRLYLSIQEIRPEVKLSAALICQAPGILRTPEWPESAAYSSLFQDWRLWMEQGILDLGVPMAYFDQSTHSLDWSRWNHFIKDHQYERHAAIGMGWFLNDLEWTLEQMETVRKSSREGRQARGMAGFSYANATSGSVDWKDFARRITEDGEMDAAAFSLPVKVPEMPWKTDPSTGHLFGRIHWKESAAAFETWTLTLEGLGQPALQIDANGYFGRVGLAAGSYKLQTKSANAPGPEFPFTIEIGKVSRLDLDLADLAVPRLRLEKLQNSLIQLCVEPWRPQLRYILETKAGNLDVAWKATDLNFTMKDGCCLLPPSTAAFQYYRVLVAPF